MQPQAALRVRGQPQRGPDVKVHDGGGGVQQVCATRHTLLSSQLCMHSWPRDANPKGLMHCQFLNW